MIKKVFFLKIKCLALKNSLFAYTGTIKSSSEVKEIQIGHFVT